MIQIRIIYKSAAEYTDRGIVFFCARAFATSNMGVWCAVSLIVHSAGLIEVLYHI